MADVHDTRTMIRKSGLHATSHVFSSASSRTILFDKGNARWCMDLLTTGVLELEDT